MLFTSLNTPTLKRQFSDAVIEGLAPDRGLYFPESLPQLPPSLWRSENMLEPWELGAQMLSPFAAPELTQAQLETMLREVLNFPLPLHQLDEHSFILELFHGPTAAFKDVGARFLARALHLLTDRRLTVLVATSGDTGSAVAQGFLNVPNIDVVILYPSGRISHIQEQQLTTVGHNVSALEVRGSFDECQAMVKAAFLDQHLQNARPLTSANSINIARWLPQSIYYAWAAYKLKTPVGFSVPSGNVGNLAAGLLAAQMGMPHLGFIAATNANDGLARYLEGEPFEARPSLRTISNAMDVGDPSNRPRLEALCGGDLARLRSVVCGYAVSEAETRETMRSVYKHEDYLLCPHSAVGYAGWRRARQERSSFIEGVGVTLATAHPAKFGDVVLEATGHTPEVPPQLRGYLEKTKHSVEIDATYTALKEYLLA